MDGVFTAFFDLEFNIHDLFFKVGVAFDSTNDIGMAEALIESGNSTDGSGFPDRGEDFAAFQLNQRQDLFLLVNRIAGNGDLADGIGFAFGNLELDVEVFGIIFQLDDLHIFHFEIQKTCGMIFLAETGFIQFQLTTVEQTAVEVIVDEREPVPTAVLSGDRVPQTPLRKDLGSLKGHIIDTRPEFFVDLKNNGNGVFAFRLLHRRDRSIGKAFAAIEFTEFRRTLGILFIFQQTAFGKRDHIPQFCCTELLIALERNCRDTGFDTELECNRDLTILPCFRQSGNIGKISGIVQTADIRIESGTVEFHSVPQGNITEHEPFRKRYGTGLIKFDFCNFCSHRSPDAEE